MSLTAAGKIAVLSERIEYQARPLVTAFGLTKYGMVAQVEIGGKRIMALARLDQYDVYASAVIAHAERLRERIIRAYTDPEYRHPQVMVKDVRQMYEAPTVTPDPPP